MVRKSSDVMLGSVGCNVPYYAMCLTEEHVNSKLPFRVAETL
jgi:hypothetical protein